MMTMVMIDVEAGKEDLFERIFEKYNKMKGDDIFENIKFLYVARCYTHSDISIMIDVKDPESLPAFLTRFVLQLDGVYDLQAIHLFNPNFINIPSYIDEESYQHFTVTLDVKSKKTEEVYNYLRGFAASEDVAITFIAYTFYAFDKDIIFTLLSSNIEQAGKFVYEKIRPIDGVIDSILWQIEKWKFAIPSNEWLQYINHHRPENPIDNKLWNEHYKELAHSYICAC